MSKIERALMIGRFQPFHKGHLLLVKDILSDCKEIIIAIGSSQFNYTLTNPFTAGERVQMIHESLVENNMNLKRVYVIPVSNSENNAIWLEQMKSTVPKFDIIYSGNELVKALIENDKRIRLKVPALYQKRNFNGTYIRHCIINNNTWKDLVPDSTYMFINEIDGTSRVKMINETQQSVQSNTGDIEAKYYPKIK
jgi:nicotinamide-nucleotide adenylyltransferase